MDGSSPERRLTFEMSDAFPADDDIALWIASLSMALNDIRTSAEYAVRDVQPEHERLYFVRVLASHIREAVKIVLLEHDQRHDVQAFVQAMPEAGQRAFEEIDRRVSAPFPSRPDVSLFDDLKRLRDDTFHYVRDQASVGRMRDALRRAAGEQGAYLVTNRALRAEYADLVRVNLAHPFDGTEDERMARAREMHEAIVGLIGPLSTFLHAAEACWLTQRTVQLTTNDASGHD